MMAAVLVTVLLLETVVFPGLALGGWRPSLVTLSVIAFALADGPETGLRYGFAAGLTADLLAGGDQLVGMSALVLLSIGYAVGCARPYLSGQPVGAVLLVAAIGSAAAVLLSGLLSVLLDAEAPRGFAVIEAALVVGLYDALLAPLVYRPVAALATRYTGNPVVG